MIRRLGDEIYPRLEQFVEEARETLRLEGAEGGVPAGHPRAEALTELEKDIEYFRQMKLIEEQPLGERRLDVVPISGLVVNVLRRLLTELETVLELWGEQGVMQTGTLSKREKSTLISHRRLRDQKAREHSQAAGLSPEPEPRRSFSFKKGREKSEKDLRPKARLRSKKSEGREKDKDKKEDKDDDEKKEKRRGPDKEKEERKRSDESK